MRARPAVENPHVSDASNAALQQRYDAIAYAAHPHPLTHPDRLAAVGTFLGMQPPAPATARVLEVGCSDGTNLVAMAMTLPQASLVGCDLSGTAIAQGLAMVDALQLRNVTLLQQDLVGLDPALGPFDYIVAHGVYSWVPPAARDALLALAARTLSPAGLLFLSYNALPGCRVRQAAWDILHYHVDAIEDVRERLAAARVLARTIADAGVPQYASDAVLRAEFADIAGHSDSALMHDDLAVPNEPFHFHEVVAHAATHGLAYLAEAELHSMSGAGLSNDARKMLGSLAPLEREQYADFMRLRRFRQSVWRRAVARVDPAVRPERLTPMHVSADPSLLRAAAAGRIDDLARGLDPTQGSQGPMTALLQRLVEVAPLSLTFADVMRVFASHAAARGTDLPAFAQVLGNAYVANVVQLHIQPPPLVLVPAARPVASPLARLHARDREEVISLVHGRVRLPDPNARRLLVLLDGTRTRSMLAQSMTGAPGLPDPRTAASFVQHVLDQFGRLGLLLG